MSHSPVWLYIAAVALVSCAPARPALMTDATPTERERALVCHQRALDARPTPLKLIAVGTGGGALQFAQFGAGFWPAMAGLAFVGAVAGGTMGAYQAGQDRDQAYATTYAACMAPSAEESANEPEVNPEAYWP